jgi:hypothetical protein
MMVLIHLHTANMFCGELTMPLEKLQRLVDQDLSLLSPEDLLAGFI